MKLLQNPATVAQVALLKESENESFKTFLKEQNIETIDKIVHQLNEEITPQIDCTQCGNCCLSLMINVEKSDAARLSAHLNISEESFYQTYIETSSAGTLSIMNKIPCHFLCENKCMVYKARPNECREFPGLHQPNFTQRLFATFMHYSRCPIVFNVVEALKERLHFDV